MLNSSLPLVSANRSGTGGLMRCADYVRIGGRQAGGGLTSVCCADADLLVHREPSSGQMILCSVRGQNSRVSAHAMMATKTASFVRRCAVTSTTNPTPGGGGFKAFSGETSDG